MIKAGDLVMVVKDCCGGWLGRVFIAGGAVTADICKCGLCGASFNPSPQLIRAENNNMFFAPISWLKKIDPPATGEYDRVPQRLKEPA